MEGNEGNGRSVATVVLDVADVNHVVPIVAQQINGSPLSIGFEDGPVVVWLTGTPAQLAAFFRNGLSTIAGIR